MDASSSLLPITAADLQAFTRRANGLLARVEWRPKAGVLPTATPTENASTAGNGPSYRPAPLEPSRSERVSLLALARQVSGDEALLDEAVNHTMLALRRGLELGMHLSKLYTEASGLERLIEQNRRGELAGSHLSEFRDKYHTAAAVAVFACAAYVVHRLSRYRPEEVSAIRLEFDGIPELSLQNPVRAVQGMLFYYGSYLEHGRVRSELDFVKMTLLYFQGILDEIQLRRESLRHLEPFTLYAYKLADKDFPGEEFVLRGFELEPGEEVAGVSFNRVPLDAIVGNREAKHGARRLVERLLCFDPKTRRNPFVELGGFPRLRLGYGKPGTGKSLQIAATATLLDEHCRELGIPFLFWPLPDTVVSTFQGGSAERMVRWMRPLQDSSKIIYAPIDDAENNLEERTRQGVSAGVREVIGVFLRYTEGAYAINHGNAAIDIFTNLPEQIDKAVLSRVVARFTVDGAESWEDFLDQDYLWWRSYQEIDPQFIDMEGPADYRYLAAQAQLSSLSEAQQGKLEPNDERLQEIFARVRKRYRPDEHAFFAELYRQVLQRYPAFSSRDVRNIQQAVNARILDFDLPDDWFENHERFFARDYDVKKALLIELMHANMKGLSFAEIRLQEAIRYLDTMARLADIGRERRIAALLEEAELRAEAARRLPPGPTGAPE